MSATPEELKSMFREAESRGDRGTAEKIMGMLDQSPPAPAVPVEPSFSERVGANLDTRNNEVRKTLKDHAEGTIGTLEANVQVFGKGVAGSLFDYIGEEMHEVGKGISLLMPETVQSLKEGWDWISDTAVGQKVGEVFEGGAEGYGDFKDSFPQQAKTLESIVNIGMIVAPAKVKANAKPSTIGKASDAFKKSAERTVRRRKRDHIRELVSPEKTKKVLVDETGRTLEEGVGPFRKSVVSLSKREVDMASELKKISGISSDNTIQGNLNVVKDANRKLATSLDAQVKNVKSIISREEVNRNIQFTLDSLLKEPTVVGNAQTTATRLAEQAKKILNSHPGTPKGVLDARKEFDRLVRRAKGDNIFDPAMENAVSMSVRAIRQSMNDMVAKHTPNVRVKLALKRQSTLFDAMENIAPKAAKEGNSAVVRAWRNTAKILPFKDKLNQDLGLLLGISGLGAAMKFAPYITGAAGALVASKVGFNVVTSPRLRKGVSILLSQIDKALITSKNPSMIKQLRADRITLLEIMKSKEDNEDLEATPAPMGLTEQ